LRETRRDSVAGFFARFRPVSSALLPPFFGDAPQPVNFEQLVADYGIFLYAAIFVWTFLEGETFVIFAGFAAHQGYLDWLAVFLAAWWGSFSGDQFYFWIGRRYGQTLLVRYPRWRPGVELALDALRRHDRWFILSFRFIYGVRNFASFAMGMSGLDPLRFAALNFLAAGGWAMSFAGFGYLFGEALEAILGDVAQAFGLAMLILFSIAIGSFVVAHKRRARRVAIERARQASLATSDGGIPPG
jgi:membrane protein DedA with SNARE-associated domain